jgi:hypothetical protein
MRTVKWEYATEEDMPALDALHILMQKRIGKKLDRPALMAEPVIGTVVAKVDGVIIQGLYAEAEIEVCACGPGVLSAKEMAEGAAMLEKIAHQFNIRIVRSFVPQELLAPKKNGKPSAIARVMKKLKMTREKPGYQQFFRWLVRRPQ